MMPSFVRLTLFLRNNSPDREVKYLPTHQTQQRTSTHGTRGPQPRCHMPPPCPPRRGRVRVLPPAHTHHTNGRFSRKITVSGNETLGHDMPELFFLHRWWNMFEIRPSRPSRGYHSMMPAWHTKRARQWTNRATDARLRPSTQGKQAHHHNYGPLRSQHNCNATLLSTSDRPHRGIGGGAGGARFNHRNPGAGASLDCTTEVDQRNAITKVLVLTMKWAFCVF